MKTFSNFLISEELPVDDIAGRTSTGRIIKKRKNLGKPLSAQDVERLDSARLSEIERDSRGKSGERARKDVVTSQGKDDLLNKINKDRTRPITKADKGKFFGKPTGVDVATGKAKYVPPKEIPGRSKYIDPKTNKASEKGIKNYISKARQMRTGSNVPVDSKTTDSIAKIAKTEYTDKINQKYGGRRARTRSSNQPSLAQVKAGIDRKDTLIKTNKLKRQNTSTTKVVKQSLVSKKAKKFTDTVNQSNKNITSTGTKPSTSGIKIDSKPYTPPKTSTSSIKIDTPKPTSGIKIDSKPYTPPKTSTPLIKISKPIKSVGSKVVPPKGSAKLTGNQDFQNIAKTGKLDTYKKPKTIVTKGMKTYKKFLTKVPKPIRSVARGSGKLLGKAVGPAFAAIDGWSNYKGYKKQGYNTSGAIARSGAKTGAYWGGYAAGAAKGGSAGAAIGTAIAPGVGTVIGGAIGAIGGGLIGGGIAGKVADWGIGAYDKVFGRQKLKDIKAKNIKKMNTKALKANPYKNTKPQISKSKTLTDRGNLSTITLKKGKGGAYVLPKGYEWAGKASKVTKLAGS